MWLAAEEMQCRRLTAFFVAAEMAGADAVHGALDGTLLGKAEARMKVKKPWSEARTSEFIPECLGLA